MDCRKEYVIFLLKKLNYFKKLIKIFKYYNWKGIFGSSVVITHKFIYYLHKKFNLFNLLKYIGNRVYRSI